MVEFSGACLCGNIRFTARAPSKWCAHCHCSLCRRAHGAAYVTWVGFAREQFVLTAGTPRRYASSTDATRSFCGDCGAQLFFESSRWAGEIHIARAAIAAEIDRAPQAHVFYSDRATWLDLHREAELPKRGGPTGTAPL